MCAPVSVNELPKRGRQKLTIHKSAEDYLEMILMIREQKGYVRSVDVAQALGVTKPSVSVAMKKLRENGYITMDPDGSITLNESGLAIASRIYNRHKVISEFFTLLGVSPDVSAEDACKVEHDISDETFSKIWDFVKKNG